MDIVDCNLVNPPQEVISRVQKQLEFYLDDSNLYKDKFLQNLLKQNKYLDLKVFLGFNKIKGMTLGYQDPTAVIQEAVQNSELLKLSKDKTKLKRKNKIEFDDQIIQKNIDKTTIYVENLPDIITHESLAKIFSTIGTIKHISIPTYKYSKKSKGFAFIQFSEEKQVAAAIEKYDNCIPSDFLQENSFKQQPLKVITKLQWLSCKIVILVKDTFKELKKEMNESVNQHKRKSEHIESSEFVESKLEMVTGCLIKINSIPGHNDKISLKIALQQICHPIYIDYCKNTCTAILRFNQPEEADQFFNDPLFMEGKQIGKERLEGEAEIEYWDKIKKLKNNFREYNYKKKQKL